MVHYLIKNHWNGYIMSIVQIHILATTNGDFKVAKGYNILNDNISMMAHATLLGGINRCVNSSC
jgi:hypothetical protein